MQHRTLIILNVVIVWLFLSACGAAQIQPTTTATPSPTATLTATPTATPTSAPPTPTVTPTPLCAGLVLANGEHISAGGSYSETQTEAAGRMICRIERGDCAFHLLVGNLDPNIVFKREETPPYDREDIKMHPGLLLPLFRLRELVAAEWGGAFQVRITDAYDSLLEHDLNQSDLRRRNSLHFEGRAVDLTTWPIDPSQYGRLCALAHCAGFAWVHHEGDHCHAAIKADSLCTQCAD